jgi:hypothetical protein
MYSLRLAGCETCSSNMVCHDGGGREVRSRRDMHKKWQKVCSCGSDAVPWQSLCVISHACLCPWRRWENPEVGRTIGCDFESPGQGNETDIDSAQAVQVAANSRKTCDCDADQKHVSQCLLDWCINTFSCLLLSFWDIVENI